MLEHFQIISISHKKLNTEDLERFVIKYKSKTGLKSKLAGLKKEFAIDELLYMTTCNRLLILTYRQAAFNLKTLTQLLYYINPSLEQSLAHRVEKIVDFYSGEKCIRHLFEVASSLDSLVIGEHEIFRQFRDAYFECKKFGLTGDNLRLLEQCTVAAAKDVHTTTSIGKKPVSIVSLALQKLVRLQPMKDSRILLVGAGETNTTFARFLKKYQFSDIVIFNRSLNNARELSSEIGAKAYHLTDLEAYERGFDIMICCTSATEPIITSQLYRKLAKAEEGRKILIDLSIPNNISKSVSRDKQVRYINIDSLKELADKNLKSRQGNIAASRILINYHLDNFTVMYDQRQIEKAFKKLPKEINSIKHRAINKVYKDKLDQLPEETRELVLEMMNYMEKKCIAAPIKMAKEIASAPSTKY